MILICCLKGHSAHFLEFKSAHSKKLISPKDLQLKRLHFYDLLVEGRLAK